MSNYPKRAAMFLGLDLGQAQDYSALAIITRIGNAVEEYAFHCVHLQRWPLRTSYPSIVAAMLKMIAKLPAADAKPVLAVDATGVGAPVIDLFQRETFAADLMPIQIIGGSTISSEFGVTRVPKRDLVSTVQVALQNQTLKIAKDLPETPILSAELQNFQVKITDAANDTYGAWREGSHDDLVLATALALWCAARPGVVVTEAERQMFGQLAQTRF